MKLGRKRRIGLWLRNRCFDLGLWFDKVTAPHNPFDLDLALTDEEKDAWFEAIRDPYPDKLLEQADE